MRMRTLLAATILTVALPGAFLSHVEANGLLSTLPLGLGGGHGGNQTEENETRHNGTQSGGDGTTPPGNGTHQGGNETRPGDDGTRPSGNATDPRNDTRPAGNSTETGGNSTRNGASSLQVTLDDGRGGALYFEACQDLDGDGVCGGPGEPATAGCGAHTDLPGFHLGVHVRVTLHVGASTPCGHGMPVTITLV